MQAGLMDTYHRPLRSRKAVAWVLCAALVAFYLLVYYTDVLEGPARRLRLSGKWTLYSVLYTLAMVVGGAFFLRRHGNSPYQRVRTVTVVSVQVVLAFALPLVMKVLGHQEYYFSYFWPLKIEYFYPSVILHQPFLIVLYSFLGSLVAFPLLGYFLGKRFYCSWICGCGGLANTAGDSFRHLSDKSTGAWRFEKVSVYTVLAAAVITTVIVGLNWAVGKDHPAFSAFGFGVQRWYGLVVGGFFSGVLGVGLYPLMGTRVWCRFACPMAAVLGLLQKFGRFRITVKKDMCIACGNCSTYCEMGIDVRAYAMANEDVKRAACVGCGMCAHVCPRGVLKLESRPVRFKGGEPIRVYAVDL
ncbi:MAG: 4Fe-4S ferredoxin [Acidobacteria bacterium]|nr:MAG: 4Fe-4S ferredoxin [Acidobacteriota bacterium]PYQ26127.1 MAG: 4Fe-4S ferredoxin [Acidobacteriota bacterium]